MAGLPHRGNPPSLELKKGQKDPPQLTRAVLFPYVVTIATSAIGTFFASSLFPALARQARSGGLDGMVAERGEEERW